MNKWIKTRKEYKGDGGRIIFYEDRSGRFTLESRTLPGPNGYYITTYYLVDKKEGTEEVFWNVSALERAVRAKEEENETS